MASTSTIISSLSSQIKQSSIHYGSRNHRISPAARLFGPAIFRPSKLNVSFLDVDRQKQLPRTYTLTHSDFTSNLTLSVSQSVNRSQLEGWYHKLQRDEVVAEWKMVKGKLSLHVHCHISGSHFLLDFLAKLRYQMFSKELPVVLRAFVHGDVDFFSTLPELKSEALVWVYFHSNLEEFDTVEFWGPLMKAVERGGRLFRAVNGEDLLPNRCEVNCSCCFPRLSQQVCKQD